MNKLIYLIFTALAVFASLTSLYLYSGRDGVLERDIKFLNQGYEKEGKNLNIKLINQQKTYRLANDEMIQQQASNNFFTSQKEEEKLKKQALPLDLKKLQIAYKDICLKDADGKLSKPSEKMNQKEKLMAFIKGPCSPAVLLPGIMGTSLQVEIDCETLQKEEPTIFDSCGWNTCKSYIPLVRNPPKKEYRLWISGVMDPNSIFSLGKEGGEHAKCFGNLVQLIENPDTKIEQDKYISPKGIKVSIQGNTDQTRDDSRCGNTAIEDFIDNSEVAHLSCSFKGYKDLLALMTSMGYQPGITYQSLPYDFRKSVIYVRSDEILYNSLISLKKYTGKKANIVSHSYGSLHTLFALSQDKFDQEFKDNHINQWIPTGAPFSGAPEVMKSHINTDDAFIATLASALGKKFIVGIQFESQRLNTQGSASLFDLYPKDIMHRHKNEPWMQEIYKRIEYERKSIHEGVKYENQDIPLNNVFPNTSEVCKPGISGANQYCQTFLYDQLKDPIVKIGDDEFYLKTEDIEKMLQKYADFKNDMVKMLQDNWQPAFLELINPGVKVTNVFGAFGKVEVRFTYEEDTRPYTSRQEYYFPKKSQYSGGDLTVNSNSSLMGPIKWMWEHENAKKGDTSKKPVRMVELCSKVKMTQDINDVVLENGERTFTESGYNGLDCKSFYTLKDTDSQHSCMINDPFYMQMIANLFSSKQQSEYLNLSEDQYPYFDHYSITLEQAKCSILFPGRE